MVRIAAIIPFLAMKGMAMAGRLKEKDPWDVYYCVKNFPGGLEALVAAFDEMTDPEERAIVERDAY